MQAKGKAHATVVKCYTILSSMFKMAYLADSIPKNPIDKVERPRMRKDEIRGTEVAAYTVHEVRQILTSLEHEPLKWRVFLRLLIDTGMRRGECSTLKWENMNFRDNTVTIAANLCYTPQKGVYLDTPKNGKSRSVDVDPDIMALLRALQNEQSRQSISAFVFSKDNNPEPLHPQSPTRYMKRFSTKYNLPYIHPHKLRHTFASISITSGADIASVSEKLGHSDKAVTLRMYTHADQESIKRASQIFRNALKNGRKPRNYTVFCFLSMELLSGFEPETSSLPRMRSTN